MIFTEQLPVLAHLKTIGFSPKTIIDCGSNVGDWSRLARFIYPDVPIHMIDILELVDIKGNQMDGDISNAVRHFAAIDEKIGKKTLYYSATYPALTTLYKDTWNPEDVFTTMEVPTITLDAMFAIVTPEIEAPIMLKMDIQGAELPAIRGGKNTILPKTDVIVLEVSFTSFNDNSPDFRQVINELHDYGFELFDIAKCGERHILGNMNQVDAFFVSSKIPWVK